MNMLTNKKVTGERGWETNWNSELVLVSWAEKVHNSWEMLRIKKVLINNFKLLKMIKMEMKGGNRVV